VPIACLVALRFYYIIAADNTVCCRGDVRTDLVRTTEIAIISPIVRQGFCFVRQATQVQSRTEALTTSARDCVSQSLPNSEVFVFAISNDVLNSLFFGVDNEGLHADSREEEQMGDGHPPAFDPDVLGKFLGAIFNHYGFQIGSLNLQLFLL
jgi:hypothetical protein